MQKIKKLKSFWSNFNSFEAYWNILESLVFGWSKRDYSNLNFERTKMNVLVYLIIQALCNENLGGTILWSNCIPDKDSVFLDEEDI